MVIAAFQSEEGFVSLKAFWELNIFVCILFIIAAVRVDFANKRHEVFQPIRPLLNHKIVIHSN